MISSELKGNGLRTNWRMKVKPGGRAAPFQGSSTARGDTGRCFLSVGEALVQGFLGAHSSTPT